MKTIGILGGGQLGKMLAIAAASLGFKTHIYCPEADSPAFDVATAHTQKAYDDFEALKQFAASVDVVTYEFENVPLTTVKALTNHVPVYPSWQSLQIAQHRIREKQFMKQLEIDVTPFEEIHDLQQLQDAFARMGTDCLLKTVEMGYDGKGQWWIDSNSNLEAIWQTFGSNVGILEAFVPFQKELSVIIARNEKGQCAAFPVVENIHKDGILIETIAPAHIDADVSNAALDTATLIAEALQIIGVVAVEFFYTDEGQLLVNEIAPRPHNSGHWTLNGCYTSQFEQCIRAITGLPFGDPSLHTAIRMINLIGDGVLDAPRYFSNPLAKVHLYGKQAIRPGRKMGHVNLLCRNTSVLA
jgi:5-(carboxyamino)imidazole ribonucleotide synthase